MTPGRRRAIASTMARTATCAGEDVVAQADHGDLEPEVLSRVVVDPLVDASYRPQAKASHGLRGSLSLSSREGGAPWTGHDEVRTCAGFSLPKTWSSASAQGAGFMTMPAPPP